MTKTEVPVEARGSEDTALFGLTTQGSFFMQNEEGGNPYIWNESETRRIELTPANIEAEELMRQFAEYSYAQSGIEMPADMDLFDVYMRLDGGNRLIPRPISMTFGGDYIVTQDRTGMTWMIDGETGKMYGGKEHMYTSAYGDTLIAPGQVPSGQVFLLDKKTDKLTIKDYSRTQGFDSDSCVLTATSFLSDGSIAVVLRDMKMDLDTGEICKLLIERPDGTQETYDLGRIQFAHEPEMIYSVDAQHILLTNYTTVRKGWVYYIDCTTGAVSFLQYEEGKTALEPYTSFLNEAGMVDFEPYGSSIMMILEAMADGQTILLQDDDGRLVLLKPDTLECQFLLQGGEVLSDPLMFNFTGNGYDRFCYRGEDRDRWEYYSLQTRE
ncbi:MAG: hypothetical protein IKD92_00945 [Lachnospiraceae bacterium]|nr:hypothetical protein [Lachnospiraceae bacterium]